MIIEHSTVVAIPSKELRRATLSTDKIFDAGDAACKPMKLLLGMNRCCGMAFHFNCKHNVKPLSNPPL